jgi:predicted enzyme related to lactoylglutathione lyase
MVQIKGVARFSIPVSDVEKSTKFYPEIVGLQISLCDAG